MALDLTDLMYWSSKMATPYRYENGYGVRVFGSADSMLVSETPIGQQLDRFWQLVGCYWS